MYHSALLHSLALMAALVSVSAQAEVRYRVQSLGVLAAAPDYSLGIGVNRHGDVVGYSVGGTVLGFVYRDGRMQPISSADGTSTSAVDINAHGQVVGAFTPTGKDIGAPLLYSEGRLMDPTLSLGPTRDGFAWGINEAGQVTGAKNGKAFLYDGTSSRYIPVEGAHSSVGSGINDRGQVVGTAQYDDGTRIFMYDGTTVTWLPPLPAPFGAIELVKINDQGQVIVNGVGSTGSTHAFLYTDGEFIDVGSFKGINSTAYGLGEDGRVVGSSFVRLASPLDVYHAFIYEDGSLHDLNRFLGPATASHWILDSAWDINERGQIVGQGYFNGLERAFLATPVPEPASLSLLLAGLGVVGAAARAAAARTQAQPLEQAGRKRLTVPDDDAQCRRLSAPPCP